MCLAAELHLIHVLRTFDTGANPTIRSQNASEWRFNLAAGNEIMCFHYSFAGMFAALASFICRGVMTRNKFSILLLLFLFPPSQESRYQ